MPKRIQRKELARGLTSLVEVVVPGFFLRCRICYRTISSTSASAVANEAASNGWEVTRYDPKVHAKIARAKIGDLVATCFNHSASAIHL